MGLDGLEVGASATVRGVNGPRPFRRRLLELGLVPGTRIQRVGQAPLGDPLTFSLRGVVVTLRARDAAHVRVDP
jgi:ferrous iron transport protein A